MKIKSLYIIVISLPIVLQSMGQDVKKFIGTWEGKLNVGNELRIVVHITADSAGNISSSLDSPDQSAFGIATDKTIVKENQFEFEINRLNATYSGQLINDSTINGTFTQGAALPLVLTRKKEDAVQLPDQTSTLSLSYRNIDVSVRVKNVTLSGTLFQPFNSKKSLVILIIAGSGPTDRDGNSIALPGKNNSLLQLADSLAEYGIASLRYDKRGIGKSQPDTIMGEQNLTIDNIADDAEAMYNWLMAQGYANIYIAGHSEGSLIGMMIAEKLKPAGFISIAGAGRKAGDILKEQVAAQLPGLKTELDNDIDSLERGLSVSTVNPSVAGLLRPSIQPYMKSWLRLDPQKIISRLNCPVLIVQGTKDIQIKEIDAKNLYQAKQKSKLVIINNMNHVLKQVNSNQAKDNINAYSDPGLPVMKELVTAMVNFILQTR